MQDNLFRKKTFVVDSRLWSSRGLGFQRLTGLAALLTALAFQIARADVPAPVIRQFQPPDTNGAVLLRWDAAAGSAYQVQTTTNLGTPWTMVDYIIAGTNSVTWQANGQGGTAGYYRLTTAPIAIQSVEPTIVSTGAATTVYITGQGFDSNDVVTIGGVVQGNVVVVSSTLMEVTFAPSTVGNNSVQIVSGSTGQTTTLNNPLNTVSSPTDILTLLEPPQPPPTGPMATLLMPALMKAKEKANQVRCDDGQPTGRRDHGPPSLAAARGIITAKPNTGTTGSSMTQIARKGGNVVGGVVVNSGGSLFTESGTGGGHELRGKGIIKVNLGTPVGPCLSVGPLDGGETDKDCGGSCDRTGDCDDNDPTVYPFSGEVQYRETDFAIAGRSLDFILARTYRSRTASQPNNVSEAPFDLFIARSGNNIQVFDGTGRGDVYYLGTNGVYSRPEFFNEGSLSNNVFTLTFPDTGRWVFNPLDTSPAAGKLAQIIDRNGNTISLSYDTSGHASTVVDDLGRTNTVSYNTSGQLASVTDFSGRTVTYHYYGTGDTNGSLGDLKSVTSPSVTGTPNGNDFPNGKTTTYTYSQGFSNDKENHLLTSVIDPAGNTVCRYTYQHSATSFDYLRCLSAQRGTNVPVFFTYAAQVAAPGNNYATIKVTVRDAVGNVSECLYNSRNLPVDLKEYTGRAPTVGPVTDTLNRPVNPVRSTDPAFYETQWTWNQNGLCVQETEPRGDSVRCVYESDYNPAATPRKQGDLRVWREVGLVDEGNPELVSRFNYDSRWGSPPIRARGEDGGRTASGLFNPKEYTLRASGMSTMPGASFHAINTKGAGSNDRIVPAGNGMAIKTKGTGADKNRIVPAGNSMAINTKGTGADKNRISHSGWDGPTVEPEMAWLYVRPLTGLNGRSAAAGVRTPHCFGAGQPHPQSCDFVTGFTDPNGNVTTASYDANGNQVSRITVTASSCGNNPPTVNLAYNGFGQLTAITNVADGNCQRSVDNFSYYTSGPSAGYLQSCTEDAAGFSLTSTCEHDARGNLTRCIDPRGNDCLYTYNALDQLMQSSSAQIIDSGTSYRIATQFTYDADDNLTQESMDNRDQNGAFGPTNPQWTTTCSYDLLNRCVQVQQMRDSTRSVTTQYQYDANDNLVLFLSGEAVNGNDTNKVVQYLYDERDLPFQCIAAPGSTLASTCQWDYDADGNGGLDRLVDDNGVLQPDCIYTYDGFERLVAVQDAMGNILTNGLDANGNVILSTLYGETYDVSGSSGNVVLAQTACQYDALDRCVLRLCQQNRSGDGFATTAYAYAPNSDLTSVTDPNGHTTQFAYDTVGRLSTVTDAKNNTVTCTYDACGNVLSTTCTNLPDLGSPQQVFVTTAQYDALDRCSSSSDNVGNTMQYGYDSRDNLVQQIDAKGQLSGWTYDGLGRCTLAIADMNGDGLLDFAVDAGSTTAYDDNDCVISCTDANTNTTSYAYDSLDRLSVTTCADGTVSRLVWSPRSNLISETDPNGTVVTSTYDLCCRIIHRDIAARNFVATTTTFETFAYDGCSRLTLASNDVSRLTFAYDLLGDCTNRTQDGLSTACTYDGAGNCLSMTYPGGMLMQYTYNGLDQVSSVTSTAPGSKAIALASFAYNGPGDCARYLRKNGAFHAADFKRDVRYSSHSPPELGRITRANGVNTSITWDGTVSPPNANGDLGWQQVAGVSHAGSGGKVVIDQRLDAYDADGNKILRVQTTPFVQGQDTLTNNWSYDPLNQLRRAINTKGTGSNFRGYNLDAVGNRLVVTNDGVAQLYTRVATIPPGDFQMDRYTTTPFDNDQYDTNGNLVQTTSSVSQTHYTYDYADRLVEVDDLSTGSSVPVASFTYNALGERISKTVYPPSPAAPVTTYYVCRCKSTESCGNGIVEMRAGGPSGGVIHTYCSASEKRSYTGGRFALELDGCVASFNGTGTLEYYFLSDDLGNVLALTDSSGKVLERYEYDDYGAPQFLAADGTAIIGGDGSSVKSSPLGNPFLFQGMEYDPETALYYHDSETCAWLWVRPMYMNPETGAYTSGSGCKINICGDGCILPGKTTYQFHGNNPWSQPGGNATGMCGSILGPGYDLSP